MSENLDTGTTIPDFVLPDVSAAIAAGFQAGRGVGALCHFVERW